MSGFTDQDRNMLVETHTLVKEQGLKLTDHENRIRKNEGIILKVATVSSVFAAGITIAVTAFAKKFIGN